MLDQEAVQAETLIRLKGSVTAYRGHLTRAYEEIQSLMTNPDTADKAADRKRALDNLFRNYEEASLKYSQSLLQSDDKERFAQEHTREIERKENFELRYLERSTLRDTHTLSEYETRVSLGNPSLVAAMEPHVRETDTLHERPWPSLPSKFPPVSQITGDTQADELSAGRAGETGSTGKSRTSKESKGSRVKLAMAQLKMKQLKEDLRLQRKQRDLEMDMQTERELLKARMEVEQAEIEVQLNEDPDDSDRGSVILPGLQRQSPEEAVSKYLRSYQPNPRGFAPTSYPASRQLKREPEGSASECGILPERQASHRRYAGMSGRIGTSNDPQSLHQVLARQRQTIERQEDAIGLVTLGLERLELPKREFLYFDGDPKKYPRFIKNFEVNLENRVQDNNIRLSYLIQYCTGVAKEAIENCVLLPPDRGYDEAKEILRKNFGQKHIIVQAFIEKVVKGSQIKASDPVKLLQLARDMRNCCLNSTQLRYTADINSMDNLAKVVKRLPAYLQSKWAEESSRMIEIDLEPEFSHLTEFVEKRAAVANTAFGKLVGSRPDDERDSKSKSGRVKASDTSNIRATTLATLVDENPGTETPSRGKSSIANPVRQESRTMCLFCDGNHDIERCFKFKALKFKERMDFVRRQKLCDNCLRKNHIARRCKRFRACLLSSCDERHHSLLHPPPNAASVPEEVRNSSTDHNLEDRSGGQCAAIGSGRSRVGLRIVPVRVSGLDKNHEVETYAFLDDGSDTTLCLTSLAEELGLTGTPTNFALTTINAEHEVRSSHEIQLCVKALKGDGSVRLDRVWTVDNLPISEQSIPTTEDVQGWSHLSDIELPQLEGKRVTILIGTDTPEAHWILEERRGRRKQPYAARTLLGWTVIGPMERMECHRARVNFINGDQIAAQIKNMYEADFCESTPCSQAMSVEDRTALAIMNDSVTMVNGHYQLPLPWRNKTASCLPNNRRQAEGRLRLLKKRLQRDSALFDKYKETIEGYLTKGYARKVPPDQKHPQDRTIWYLPHHPVFHPQKPGKVRVVFDCAAKYKGTSLNDQLLQGPDLTNSLVGVLIRFRQEPIALVADVEAMFHQVRVQPVDCDALRFLWWPSNDLSEDPVDHQMLVHLFGATSSPSCASFSLKRTAKDNQSEFDAETVSTVNRNFYVDDCLKSVMTTSKATRLTGQLRDLLSRGGFNLAKWVSNDKKVLAAIPENVRSPSVLDLDLEGLPIERALGIHWNLDTDSFSFRIVDKGKMPTRRGILSVTSSMYDPLGFAAPLILPAKRLLQRLCKEDYGWDEHISLSDLTQWDDWSSSLLKLREVTVQRCFKPIEFGELQQVQLHHFSDASQSGYGAVSYLRLVDTHGNVHCSFVLGKSRVAPMKTVSIPRLELTAAVVSVRLNHLIHNELEYPIHDTVYWTDSTSVLQYIANVSRRFQTFVANRLATIHDESSPSQWRYVNTTLNPADIASRGLKATETSKIHLWLNGPEFLWKDESQWPRLLGKQPELPDDHPELKKVQVNTISHEQAMDAIFSRYSSWYKLQKAVAWLIRFKNYCTQRFLKCQRSTTLLQGPLKVFEIHNATMEIVKQVQKQAFSKELSVLEAVTPTIGDQLRSTPARKKIGIGKASVLRKLNPVLVDDVIRVGGRLEKAQVPFEVKHPVVMPSKHHVTELIIRNYHQQEGHCGPTQVLAAIRQKFWIIRGHSAVRRTVGNCLDCRKRNARPGEQVMAPLPSARMASSDPPFSHVGVDYFGPLLVKQGRSTVKRYGCLFTCLVIRAVHIEVAHTLETDSFLCAYRRFVSRRGRPMELFSDNGTNFVGGARELREALQRWNQDQINDQLRQHEVQWHFNPPEASHQGGVWERLIRSVRKILGSLLREQLVNDETLLTLMAEVERILNDRPITLQSDSAQDPEALTPSKLLLLRSNSSLPPDVFTSVTDRYNKRWRQAQCLADAFWKSWIREYLPSLQERHKWFHPQRNLAVGDLVMIVQRNIPRGQWPMAIVEEVFPDRNNDVRQVIVRTATTRLRRDIRKLCLLEGSHRE